MRLMLISAIAATLLGCSAADIQKLNSATGGKLSYQQVNVLADVTSAMAPFPEAGKWVFLNNECPAKGTVANNYMLLEKDAKGRMVSKIYMVETALNGSAKIADAQGQGILTRADGGILK